jgi:hypothetical protein
LYEANNFFPEFQNALQNSPKNMDSMAKQFLYVYFITNVYPFMKTTSTQTQTNNSLINSFPNPITRGDLLNIQAPTSDGNVTMLELISLFGQSQRLEFEQYGETITTQIPTIVYPGVYFIRLTSHKDLQLTQKLIIK